MSDASEREQLRAILAMQAECMATLAQIRERLGSLKG